MCFTCVVNICGMGVFWDKVIVSGLVRLKGDWEWRYNVRVVNNIDLYMVVC